MPVQNYHVIDSFRIDKVLAVPSEPRHWPVGAYVVLDPAETGGVLPPIPGQAVTVRRPDGTSIELFCDGGEVNPHGLVVIRFTQLDRDDIPRLSQISWD